MGTRLFLPLFVLAFAACGGSSSAPASSVNAPPIEGEPAGEVAPPNGPAPDACAANEVPLILTYAEDGVVDSQLVAASAGSREGLLAIDTGSAKTFLYGSEEASDRDVRIGCETFRVGHRDFEPETFDGKPIIGVLGADFFVSVTTDFDFPKKRIVRHRTSAPPPEPGYLTVPLVNLGGHIGLQTKIDGVESLLLYDTGAHYATLVPAEGRPTDEQIVFGDMSGAENKAFLGPSDLTIGTETRRVLVKRVPSWPYFEGYQKELHPDLRGILGLTGLGHRRLIVRKEERLLEIGPIVPVPK